MDPQGTQASQERQPERSAARAASTALDHRVRPQSSSTICERPNSGDLESVPGKCSKRRASLSPPGPPETLPFLRNNRSPRARASQGGER
jgi:hypothetical protein